MLTTMSSTTTTATTDSTRNPEEIPARPALKSFAEYWDVPEEDYRLPYVSCSDAVNDCCVAINRLFEWIMQLIRGK